MAQQKITRVAQLKTSSDFLGHLQEIKVSMPFKEYLNPKGSSRLSNPLFLQSGEKVGNRFCILPMEGWDGTTDGLPSEHTKRRWHHFAISGAKLLWGCEAVAVRHDGRANPNQLMINEKNLTAFKDLYENLRRDHKAKFGKENDLVIGLQLTHSGRFAVPDRDRLRKPFTLYKHSVLDEK